jgi:hypothetical protein
MKALFAKNQKKLLHSSPSLEKVYGTKMLIEFFGSGYGFGLLNYRIIVKNYSTMW